ncbi:RcnB family protein [Acinetobacter rathckeae]|uniref:RcnB family protein n=1 Tax=Acinetobacter rathckeae TaxID=2605272 RepID=UPI0018A294EC|nr:RcnB family protein [Acinetobacter rathckeae]MBF7687668.1 RcnB family protein [Acinetobacter rathckeae]MBF7695070.1 RcnB family protein [Acinetobacter rathckeae]
MKPLTKRLLTVGLIASTTFTSIAAFAGPNDPQRGPDDFSDRQPNQQRHSPNGPQPQFQQRDRGPDRPHQQGPYYAQQGPRGENPQWRKGQYIPKQYRSSHYYVNDWRRQQLPTPPRGHRWLNVNGDYILVAVATGVISSILLHQH